MSYRDIRRKSKPREIAFRNCAREKVTSLGHSVTTFLIGNAPLLRCNFTCAQRLYEVSLFFETSTRIRKGERKREKEGISNGRAIISSAENVYALVGL